jgi:hypothetical protein
LLLLGNELHKDPDAYWRLAANLVEHGTFGQIDAPTAFRPPVYPLLLTGCVAFGEYGRMAVGALHLLLGVATVGVVLVLGRRWGLLALTWDKQQKCAGVIAGIVLGLASLCRPTPAALDPRRRHGTLAAKSPMS